MVNIYIVYEISKNINISDYPKLKTIYLEQLVWIKILILISVSILDMELDLIDMEVFNFLVLD